MFDLFRSRAKAVRYLLGAVLLLVALSMVITLIPGFGSSPVREDSVVAKVGKDVVRVQDVQAAMRNLQRRGSVPAELVQHFVPQVIDQLITERAVAYQAQRMGMEVTEADLASAIRSLVPQLFQGDQFAGRDAYAAFLSQQNLSIEEFEASVSRQVLLERMRSIALQGVIVSPQEIETAFRARNEKAKIEYIKISNEALAAQVKPTPEQLRDYFTRAAATFRIPEKRTLTLLVVDQAKVEASISIPEADLERIYKADPDRFRQPDRVHARHILIGTSDKPKEDEPKLKAKAESLLKQVRSGADFAKLAQENSDDTGSKAKGGMLDWILRGQTVPEFEKAAFTLKPNEISDLVKTSYGYHIIQVLATESARMRSFAEVKNDLAAEVKRQRVVERMQSLSDQAEAALRKDPQNPARIASEYGLTLVKAEKIAPGDPIPEVGSNREFVDMAFAAKKGEVLQPLPLGSERMVLSVVTDIFPPRQAEYAEVEKQVRERMVAEEVSRLFLRRADEVAAKAKAAGDLRQAAQAFGLQVKTSEEFTRNGAIEGVGSAAFLEAAFTQAPGTVAGPVAVSDVRVIYKVLSHTPANMAELAAQTAAIRDEIKGRKARERNSLFEDSIKQGLERDGKIKIYQDAVQRIIAGFRG